MTAPPRLSIPAETIGFSRFRLFRGLDERYQDELAELCERRELSPGEDLIRQGEPAEALYLIESGEFEVLREVDGAEYALNRVGPGADVGMMAVLEGGRRTATVRARTASSAYRLPFAALETRFGEARGAPYAVILRNHLLQTSEFLGDVGTRAAGSLREHAEELARRLAFGRFVAFLIGSVTLYAFLLRLTFEHLRGVDSAYVSAFILAGALAIFLPMMKLSGIPMRDYGFNMRNWRESLRESLVWTAWFVAGVTALKYALVSLVPAFSGAPLFGLPGFTRYAGAGEALLYLGIYIAFVPAQEIIARGAMQASLREFLSGRHKELWANVLATLMFAQIHLHLNPGYAVAVLFPGLFWGVIYARQRSLFGVTVSHLIIGVYVAFILGTPLMDG